MNNNIYLKSSRLESFFLWSNTDNNKLIASAKNINAFNPDLDT
ncbi:hypothetical protein [Bacillus thuringiensis]|nr:hypothetical protein [Bacillus thuringiensis]